MIAPFCLTLPLPPLPITHIPATLQRTMAHTSGPTAMPLACSKHVPSFTGDINKPIWDFIQEYEELADRCGLSNCQKVETIIWYIDPSQCNLWKSLKGYITCDWNDLCLNLHQEYIDPTPQGWYSKQKLLEFTGKTSNLQMKDEGDVIKYYRSFNLLSRPLLDTRRITTGECNVTFLSGFHLEDRKALWECLIAKKLDTLKGQAIDIKDILDTIRAIFSGDDDLFMQDLPPWRHKSD